MNQHGSVILCRELTVRHSEMILRPFQGKMFHRFCYPLVTAWVSEQDEVVVLQIGICDFRVVLDGKFAAHETAPFGFESAEGRVGPRLNLSVPRSTGSANAHKGCAEGIVNGALQPRPFPKLETVD